ncbi:MAG TPA: imidazole glycerol phosphate synthase subunit HisF [Candidatus Margulisbacteria bacterium]|nr:MAG: hypothetical protein A2X43_00235 [Candidatus Margulisbacteria bacterium GWD2_39_127]HAR62791.1 imidazole glycerol phosphate synthase subunit HisF [Candidatus Margulisiibacteriota bacterium]
MLKKRIIPKFLFNNGRLVKGLKFHNNHREAGNPISTAKVYDSYGVDELIFLNIFPGDESKTQALGMIRSVSKDVFMPLTVGGGVNSLKDIHDLLQAGADKVSINTAALDNPSFINEAAKHFGSQCIVVSIDYKEVAPNVFRVFSHGGTTEKDFDPLVWSLKMQENNCGEILLTSIDRDGTMEGYDLDMIKLVSHSLFVPVIASSGAGSLNDCMLALTAGASAITISSMFFFTDHSPIKVRSFLRSSGIDVRASKSSRN